jgi:hypothetical protein
VEAFEHLGYDTTCEHTNGTLVIGMVVRAERLMSKAIAMSSKQSSGSVLGPQGHDGMSKEPLGSSQAVDIVNSNVKLSKLCSTTTSWLLESPSLALSCPGVSGPMVSQSLIIYSRARKDIHISHKQRSTKTWSLNAFLRPSGCLVLLNSSLRCYRSSSGVEYSQGGQRQSKSLHAGADGE